jgi:hypothetical protein
VPAIVASYLGDFGQGRVGVSAPARPVFRLPIALWLAASAFAVVCQFVFLEPSNVHVSPSPVLFSIELDDLRGADSAGSHPAKQRHPMDARLFSCLFRRASLHNTIGL